MRRQKEVSLSVLGSRARWFESVPQRSKAKDLAPLKVKEVWVEGRRYVVCLNEEERRKDAHDREAIVAHLKEQLLERSTKAWSATRDTAAISKSKEAATLSSMKNRSKPKSATTGFGYCGLTLFIMPRPSLTSTRRSPTVEDIIRTAKSILETLAHLPQVQPNHSWPCVLQLPCFASENRAGTAHEICRLTGRMGTGASRS